MAPPAASRGGAAAGPSCHTPPQLTNTRQQRSTRNSLNTQSQTISASSAVSALIVVCGSQNVPGQILVLHDVGQHLRDVGFVDRHDLLDEIRALERNLVEQLF